MYIHIKKPQDSQSDDGRQFNALGYVIIKRHCKSNRNCTIHNFNLFFYFIIMVLFHIFFLCFVWDIKVDLVITGPNDNYINFALYHYYIVISFVVYKLLPWFYIRAIYVYVYIIMHKMLFIYISLPD